MNIIERTQAATCRLNLAEAPQNSIDRYTFGSQQRKDDAKEPFTEQAVASPQPCFAESVGQLLKEPLG